MIRFASRRVCSLPPSWGGVCNSASGWFTAATTPKPCIYHPNLSHLTYLQSFGSTRPEPGRSMRPRRPTGLGCPGTTQPTTWISSQDTPTGWFRYVTSAIIFWRHQTAQAHHVPDCRFMMVPWLDGPIPSHRMASYSWHRGKSAEVADLLRFGGTGVGGEGSNTTEPEDMGQCQES